MVERDPFVVSRPVGEGYVLIPLRRCDGHLEENVLSLQGVAARIWDLLPSSLDALVERLEIEYDVESERLRADVTAFVAHLEELRAVRQKPSDGR